MAYKIHGLFTAKAILIEEQQWETAGFRPFTSSKSEFNSANQVDHYVTGTSFEFNNSSNNFFKNHFNVGLNLLVIFRCEDISNV